MQEKPLGILESAFAEIQDRLDKAEKNSEELKKLILKLLPPDKDSQDNINIKEAALILGYKKAYVYSLIRTRSIPFFKVGRMVRFSRSELEIWVKSGRPDIQQNMIDQMSANFIVNSVNNFKSAS